MIEIKNISEWEVFTPSGWSDFSGIKIQSTDEYIHLFFSNNSELKCTPNHLLKINDVFIEAKNLSVGLIFNDIQIIKIKKIIDNILVYDLLDVKLNNEYYTNNVISHNCGVGNWFHKTYQAAEQGLVDDDIVKFLPIRLPWTVHPERDSNWEKTERSQMNNVEFAQEHEVSFEKSGNTVIDYETIEYFEKNHVTDPIFKSGFDKNLWIWKNPEMSKSYIISGDVARGDGSDWSAGHVVCVEDLEQVAEYRAKVTPDVFGEILLQLGYKYNNAMIIVENNSIGYASVQKLLDKQYPKVYWTTKTHNDLFVDPLNWSVPGENKIPGFQTTMRTRPLLIAALEESLRSKAKNDDGLIIHSSRLLDELKTFIWVQKSESSNTIKAEALKGYNDDLVMSLGIGIYAKNTTLRVKEFDAHKVNVLLDSMRIQSGKEIEVSTSKDMNKKPNPYKIGTGKTEIDLSWLLSE